MSRARPISLYRDQAEILIVKQETFATPVRVAGAADVCGPKPSSMARGRILVDRDVTREERFASSPRNVPPSSQSESFAPDDAPARQLSGVSNSQKGNKL